VAACDDAVIEWLLEGDPAIRRQVLRYVAARRMRSARSVFHRLSPPGLSISTSWVPGMRFCKAQRPRGVSILVT